MESVLHHVQVTHSKKKITNISVLKRVLAVLILYQMVTITNVYQTLIHVNKSMIVTIISKMEQPKSALQHVVI